MDGLILFRVVPDSKLGPDGFVVECDQPPMKPPVDKDGHCVMIWAGDWPSDDFVSVLLQRGLASTAAANVLRKLADKVENYPSLMVMPAREIYLCDEDGKLDEKATRPDAVCTTDYLEAGGQHYVEGQDATFGILFVPVKDLLAFAKARPKNKTDNK